MSNTVKPFILAVLTTAIGCGSKADATPRISPAAPTPVWHPGPPSFEPAIGVPDGGPSAPVIASLDDISVFVEEAVRETPRSEAGGAPTGSYFLSLKIKVTSAREGKVLPLVDAKRFQLELGDGAKVPSRLSWAREPGLGSVYLKKGDSACGWLSFQVPAKAKKLALKTDFTKQAVAVPAAKDAEDL